MIQSSGIPKPWFSGLMILITTALWGFGFPIMKALGIEQRLLLPSVNTLFASFVTLSFRFFIAALFVLPFCLYAKRSFTKKEVLYGFWIGLFLGLGGVLQLDAINYTSASICGFLTAFYVVLVPVCFAIAKRTWPSMQVMVCTGIVLAGIAILSGIDIFHMGLGRGEWETLVASCLFCGQILMLAKINPDKEHWAYVTLFMCLTVAVVLFAGSLCFRPHMSDMFAMHASVRSWVYIVVLALFCTTGSFALMNRFQPYLHPTTASVIYCAEPIFVVFFALFMPQMIVRDPRMYPNEIFTGAIIIGGALITLANIVVQIPFGKFQKSKASG